jgi:hypothetical protein
VPIRQRARRALFPIAEREFTYARYDAFLELLAARGCSVISLRELREIGTPEEPVVGLRHDVDDRLESALELGRLEHARGMRSTYFVLHTAEYWSSPRLVDSLMVLQDEYGHEIGLHNDLVTLQCLMGVEPRAYLQSELDRLRAAGIAISGVSSHGSPYCYRFGYHNNYFFSDFEGEVVPGFPNTDVVETPRGRCEIARGSLAEFGFEYEAYHLGEDAYFSDASFTNGSRWHPQELDAGELVPGRKTIVLVHPCHWDASLGAKVRRFGQMVAAGKWRAPDSLSRL